jgi:hypothetical protein
VFLRERHDRRRVGNRIGRAGNERGAHLLGNVPSLDLVAERLDRRRWWTDPDQPGIGHGLGEGRVLGQESVPGMNGVGTASRRYLQDLGSVEVGLGGSGSVERIRLVGH